MPCIPSHGNKPHLSVPAQHQLIPEHLLLGVVGACAAHAALHQDSSSRNTCGNCSFVIIAILSILQIRIRDPNQGGKDITEEIMSGGGSRNPTPPIIRPTSTPTPPQVRKGCIPPPVTFALLCLSLTLPTTPLTISETWMLLNYQYSNILK